MYTLADEFQEPEIRFLKMVSFRPKESVYRMFGLRGKL